MRSSTSSSSRSTRRSPRGLIFGLLAFVACASLGPWVPPWGQLGFGAAGRPTGPLPPGEWYADYTPGRDARSHRVLWYGIGDSIESARRADVMFFGDSRALFALPPAVARPFFEQRGLSWFHMAFARGERYAFALSVLRRHDLRPAIAVVDAGRFFEPGATPLAQELTVKTKKWPAQRDRFETAGSHFFEVFLRPAFPHLLPMLFDRGSSRGRLDLRRSVDDGSWLVRRYRDRRYPLTYGEVPLGELPDPRAARRFQAHLEAYGGQLVLTHVPSPAGGRARVESLAKQLGVPFVAPRPDGLLTSDGVHLAPESAERFASALLEKLERAGVFAGLAAPTHASGEP